MKKLFTLALVSFGLAFSTVANAQGVKFGLKAGLNVTDMHLSSKVLEKSNQVGGFVGPTVKFSLPLTGLGIDASALYDYRSAKVSDIEGEEQTVKQQQIAIPVNLSYAVGLGSTANVFFFAGPQWGINVGAKASTDSQSALVAHPIRKQWTCIQFFFLRKSCPPQGDGRLGVCRTHRHTSCFCPMAQAPAHQGAP